MYFFGNFILPFIFLVHSTLADDPHDDVRSTCRNENGLSEDEAAVGYTNLVPQLGPYVKCVFLAVGVLDADGVMIPEQLVSAIGRDLHDEAEPTIFECAEETKDIEDTCEKVLEFLKCFKEVNPETYAKLAIFGKPAPGRKY